jgi:hypothetical protein
VFWGSKTWCLRRLVCKQRHSECVGVVADPSLYRSGTVGGRVLDTASRRLVSEDRRFDTAWCYLKKPVQLRWDAVSKRRAHHPASRRRIAETRSTLAQSRDDTHITKLAAALLRSTALMMALLLEPRAVMWEQRTAGQTVRGGRGTFRERTMYRSVPHLCYTDRAAWSTG